MKLYLKRRLIVITSIFLLLAVAFFLWKRLPFQIHRNSDMEKGNVLVTNLREHLKATRSLPETGDWKVLDSLGFDMNDAGTRPDYKKLSDTSFQLTFLEGFDGPYLTYRSSLDKWVME